jgi:hypothetical protein
MLNEQLLVNLLMRSVQCIPGKTRVSANNYALIKYFSILRYRSNLDLDFYSKKNSLMKATVEWVEKHWVLGSINEIDVQQYKQSLVPTTKQNPKVGQSYFISCVLAFYLPNDSCDIL